MLLSKLTRFPWKHNKTKIMAETAMTEGPTPHPVQVPTAPPTCNTPGAIEIAHINPLDLHPCTICGRTFLPQPLRKHHTVCEKNATRKRKVFNSLKQRVEGTDLEPFHQRTILSKPDVVGGSVENKLTAPAVTPAVVRRRPSDAHAHTVLAVQVKPNRWKEKHLELMNTIRAAKENLSVNSSGLTITQKASVLSMSSGQERCPSCDRAFGPKAFDRHVEWCKEHKARIMKSPACDQEAKERLNARIKYRVPPLNKSKRTIKDKYSTLNLAKTPDAAPARSPLMTKSTTSLETIQKQQQQHRSPTSVASTTALHSRSSFRLKDVAPRVQAVQRGGKVADCGDRYQTTPVVVKPKGVHEAVVKGFGSSGGVNSNATSTTDRLKKLSTLKRSISLLDPVMPAAKPLKTNQDVNDFFLEQEHKQLMQHGNRHDENYQKEIEPSSLEKKEELFSVDDDLLEEYKLYEQMYLQEKEEKRLNALAYANEEDLSSKKSSDSAYGSLNRKPSKARSSRHAKLTPLEPLPYVHPTAQQQHHQHYRRTDSASSSGSDMSTAARQQTSQPIPIPPTNVTRVPPPPATTPKGSSVSPLGKVKQLLSPRQMEEKMSKFCHECGSKYPLNSAKFCVECGIKRLIL